MDIKKISNDIIENFEKHYKENVIQPTICVNCDGNIISYIYSNQGNTSGKHYEKRVYKRTVNGYDELGHKYGMVYMDIPNNKQIRYNYVFYDGQQEKEITTFATMNDYYTCDNCCTINT